MGEGFIVRKGGAVTEQALAPTITEISTDLGEINFTITNNDTETAVIVYETNDPLPDKQGIQLAGGATSDTLTISGLTVSPSILYASANVVGKVKSNITEKSFTFTPIIYIAATGGTTLEYNLDGKRYRSHTFTSDGDFVVTTVGNDDRNQVDYLIIAGGGSGSGGENGSGQGGAGGAGGYRTTLGTSGENSSPRDKVTVTAQTYGIVVGAGGATSAVNGTSSTAFGVSTVGGGAGGNFNGGFGQAGGSGGGGAPGLNVPTPLGGAGTTDEGFKGGNGRLGNISNRTGGGGGGASQPGVDGVNQKGGDGGNGIANILRTGSPEFRAGGGGGGVRAGTNGTGGIGGGGNGGNSALANTGGGGGGGTSTAPTSGPLGIMGGSGIVIIRYEIEPN